MAGVRFSDVQSRPIEFLDLTSLTLDEFEQLIPPFAAIYKRWFILPWCPCAAIVGTRAVTDLGIDGSDTSHTCLKLPLRKTI